jgi:hypothetical protein
MNDRKPGGVSRSVDYLCSSLTDLKPADDMARLGAILELAELLKVAIEQAAVGDRECGSFLAELLGCLAKNRSRLSKANEAFSRSYARWESARTTTRKSSPLRSLIHRIIGTAMRDWRLQWLAREIPHSSLAIIPNETLLALPEFGPAPEVVNAWTEAVVYPELRAMESSLALDPVIGSLRKALDENGKFHVSRLKPLIRQTVARIAKVPPSYYFDIS